MTNIRLIVRVETAVPSQSPWRAPAAPGRPLLPCGQFTLSPRGEPLFAYTASGNLPFNKYGQRNFGKKHSGYKTASGNLAFNKKALTLVTKATKRYKTASGNLGL